jgi:integrase
MDPDSLASDEQSLVDVTSLSSPIIPALKAFQDRLHSPRSWRVYQQDIKHFLSWLAASGVTSWGDVTRNMMYSYHAHLRRDEIGKGKTYSNNTINRMFTVARRLLGILTEEGIIAHNPCDEMAIKTMPIEDETTHVALKDTQAVQLLAQIDQSTCMGKRDYALVSLLMRTGLRRNEARMLNIGDLHMEQGHYVATIHYAKGGKPGRVKIPPDVWRKIQVYQESFPRQYNSLDAPLFVSFRKGDHPSVSTGREVRIDEKAIEVLVKNLGASIGVPGLTPHGLRATFITLALENKATLEQTQYAARHKDARMTERYRKRKLNLDDNAVDKLSFLASED